jgi:hypothetical protein
MADGGRTFVLHEARHISDAAHIIIEALANAALPTLRPRTQLLPRIELASLVLIWGMMRG